MDQDTYDKGLAIRTAVLGEEYVRQAAGNVDAFSKPLQDLVTEYCWGAVWGRDGLELKTRSMLNLAMIAVLNRPTELRTHIRGAITNGVTREEICEIFLQVGIYAGIPAAVDSFRLARAVFAELDQAPDATDG
ncbi:4-carboxymuconolactone decarboxylase [Mycobacterium frederiksbergense]|uniref:4-carboxymuconolactone decarboxylase n=1 Tax=Mycolicibacterium frederiksbergense TaxID=117567 RepID=A0ABT6KS98_9MYCO|nr:carboxymuconolactone decarboxylase family protein [Mycolicibacterium frederiksbergense]MDH6193612.1 4-carboxymuconolactone decarboxylase [Mycolicibacterium frederiksbergense]